jgi:predicted enzyme related to lactoylglutathione lyase
LKICSLKSDCVKKNQYFNRYPDGAVTFNIMSPYKTYYLLKICINYLKLNDMKTTESALNWFEISTSDISRAKKFYEQIFDISMTEQEMMGMKMAFFPTQNMSSTVGGGLVQSDMHKPSMDGAVVYLNANPDLNLALSKVEASGGKVLMPKTLISEDTGYMAFFLDTEGNKVALHSGK